MAKLGNGVAVIPSARVRSIESDYPQDSDYRENNDFFYLTGLETPGASLVLVARKDRAESGRPVPAGPGHRPRNGPARSWGRNRRPAG